MSENPPSSSSSYPEFSDAANAPLPLPEHAATSQPVDPNVNPVAQFQAPVEVPFKRPETAESGAIEVKEDAVAVDGLEGVVSYSEKVYSNGARHVYGERADGTRVHTSYAKVLEANDHAGDMQGTKEQFEARQAHAAKEAKKADAAISPDEKAKRTAEPADSDMALLESLEQRLDIPVASVQETVDSEERAKRDAEAADFGVSPADYDAIMDNADLSVAQKFQKLAEAKPAADFAAEHPEGHKDFSMTAVEYRTIMEDSALSLNQKIAQLEQYRDWAAGILKQYGLRPREYRHIMDDPSLTIGQKHGKLERSRLWMKKFEAENGVDGAQYRTIMDNPGLNIAQKKKLLDDTQKRYQSGVMAPVIPINSRSGTRPARVGTTHASVIPIASRRSADPFPMPSINTGSAAPQPTANIPTPVSGSAESAAAQLPDGPEKRSLQRKEAIAELLRTRAGVLAGSDAEAKRLQDEQITELFHISPDEFDETIKNPAYQTAGNRAIGALQNDMLIKALRLEMFKLSDSMLGYGPRELTDQERTEAQEEYARLDAEYNDALDLAYESLPPRKQRVGRRIAQAVLGRRAA